MMKVSTMNQRYIAKIQLFSYTVSLYTVVCMIHHSNLFSSYVIVASLPSYFSCYSHTRRLTPGASMSLQR